LIGEPVALTPGLGPHDDVLVLAAALLLLELVAAGAALAELDALDDAPPDELLELLPLLPHAATASNAKPHSTPSPSRLSGPLSQLPISPPRL
jgi:hypothetical protein